MTSATAAATVVCRITNAKGHITEYATTGDAFKAISVARSVSKKPIAFVGVVGSRRRDGEADRHHVTRAMVDIRLDREEAGERVVFVSGDCPQGADRFCQLYCQEARCDLIEFPAAWQDLSHPDAVIKLRADGARYDARAGFRRNAHIAHLATILLASPAPDRRGGTEDTIKKFVQAKGEDHLILV